MLKLLRRLTLPIRQLKAGWNLMLTDYPHWSDSDGLEANPVSDSLPRV